MRAKAEDGRGKKDGGRTFDPGLVFGFENAKVSEEVMADCNLFSAAGIQ